MIFSPYQSESIFYGDKLALLEGTRVELLRKTDRLRQDYASQSFRDPVDHCMARIKSAENMEEKLRRRGLPITPDAALSQIHDAVGIRVVCTFIDDVYEVRDWFMKQPEITVAEEKDYIKSPKPNGYRSYHMVIETTIDEEPVYAEIQIRTLAMDCWASLEHQLKYKQNILYQKMMVDELKRCADEIASTDMNLQAIRDMIVPASEPGIYMVSSPGKGGKP